MDLTGVAGMPEVGVDAVVLNLTAINTATPAAGYLRVFPPDIAPPAVSSLNFQHGETLSNAVTVRVSADGRIRVRADVGAADVVLDLQGWYSATTRTWTYAYDGDGYRTQRSAPDGTVTGFTWDRSDPVPKLLTQTSTGGERTYLIYGPGGHPYAQITGTEAIYYHRDQLGSTRLLTDASGDPVGTYTYDAYGALTDSTGTAAPLLGYAGEYTDHETGYTYLRARHYDPTTGQFLTRDPLVDLTGEPYAYAGNNPLSYTDPTGLCNLGPVRIGFMTNGDGGCRGAGTLGEAVDVSTELSTLTLNTLSGVNSVGTLIGGVSSGGNCHAREWRLECIGAFSGNGRPWAMGNVIMNPERSELSGDRFRHESRHGRQWALLGWSFPGVWLADSAQALARHKLDGSPHDLHAERFMCLEWWAGLDDGGYRH